jgi:cytochrome c oxidase subunit 4
MSDTTSSTNAAASHGSGSGASPGSHGGSHGVGHVAPLRALIGTGLALLVLTWITVAVSKVHLGEANIYVALGIAVIKGTLVALFFMHLRWDRPFNGIILVTSLVFVALFLAFTMADTREYRGRLDPGDAKAVVAELEKLPPS